MRGSRKVAVAVGIVGTLGIGLCALAAVDTTASGCWGFYKGRLDACARDAGNAEARAECYRVAKDLLNACLAQVPVANPPPTWKDCWNQFIADLQNCQSSYPAGPTHQGEAPTTVQERRSACLRAATEKWSWCFGRVPSPKITMVTPEETWVAAGTDELAVNVTSNEAKTYGGLAWFIVEDNTNSNGYSMYLGGAVPSIGMGETVAVKLSIPAEAKTSTKKMEIIFQGMISQDDTNYSAAGATHFFYGN